MTALPRGEYPRPHFDRSHSWRSLNGEWEFTPDPWHTGRSRGLPADAAAWPLRIIVPFAWETPASGVGLQWMSCGWYRRRIEIPPEWAGQRVVLHFGAVHHTARVWVDGVEAGSHEGGYTPFELDITDLLAGPAATVVVQVDAPLDKRDIAHGKQRSMPRDDYDGCSFTPSSGIWQSVWLEARPATFIKAVSLRPSDGLDAIVATVGIAGHRTGEARLTIRIPGEAPVGIPIENPIAQVSIPVTGPRLWHPDDPYLYDVIVELHTSAGIDVVGASTGLRSIRAQNGQILLNGERLYMRGVLDQGYWPETGITAPDDGALVADLRLARDAGFNLVRKHLKLEDPRFLHHADRLGMLVWAEPPSTGRFSSAALTRFESQIEAMVHRDGNHPSIVVWGLYNEEWGLDWDVPGDPAKQDALRRAFRRLKSLDPSRPAVDNSGWAHVDTDLVDWHIYDETPVGWQRKVRALLSGQTNRFPVSIAVDTIVQKALMSQGGRPPSSLPNLNSEYGGGYTSVERGWNMHWQTQELRRHDNVSGYVWTELYDIEHETAGIASFDRTAKDLAGFDPALVNAETVLVLDVEPLQPGLDLVTGTRDVTIGVRISHHGTAPAALDLETVWGPPLLPRDPSVRRDRVTGDPVDVKPFELSETVTVQARMPDGASSARLHLLAVRSGTIVAASCLDVVLDRP